MSKRLFEAMLEANHRALAGDSQAGLHPAEYSQELPLVALTCVDARLNSLLPQALGVPADEFIWLRNAGNIITGPMSSTMRSLALACAVKGGKEIVIIGHTDCQVGKTTTLMLLERFKALGIERHVLPDNLNEFFGMFGSDRQNVLKAVQITRESPLIGPRVPVQGLLIDIESGRLEWIANGYDALEAASSSKKTATATGSPIGETLGSLDSFKLGDLKFPEIKIGEVVSGVGKEILHRMESGPPLVAEVSKVLQAAATSGRIDLPVGFDLGQLKISETKPGESLSNLARDLTNKLKQQQSEPPKPEPAPAPPKIPLPPPIRPKMHLRRNPK